MSLQPIMVNMTVTPSTQTVDMSVDANEQTVPVTPEAEINPVINRNYNALENKPRINGVELIGDKSSAELHIIYSATTAEWNAQLTLIAEKDAIYVYTDHATVGGHEVAGIKVGDGTSYLIDMPFVGAEIAAALLSHTSNTVIHVTAEDKSRWDAKTSVSIDGEILIFD